MSISDTPAQTANPIPFKAETRQLLNILVHSLYTEKEVFIRELISNSADALTRINFEMLTNREVLDQDAELAIWITFDEKERVLYIRDSGIGMTSEELVENLGTIAHSGARAFLEALEKDKSHLSEIIGQFGVGFYSAFMAAEWIRVTSRSFRQETSAATWYSTGGETYTVEPADMKERGTLVTLKLKEDAAEFCGEYRLQEIIKKHSDYIPYPIYLGEEKKQVNNRTALWRQPVQKIEEETYLDFYKQLTLDWEPPITHIHLAIDAPVQLYALLYIPSSSDKNIFSLRKEEGLKLFARKVLIKDYSKDLLPGFLQFVQGVVDSEDLPLNISRESVQSTRLMAQINKLITNKIIDALKTLAISKPDDYLKFWKSYGRFIAEGVAADQDYSETLYPLLRFETMLKPEHLNSLDDYIKDMKEGQNKIYYILGDDIHSLQKSPHLEAFRKLEYDVLLMSDPIAPFVLLKLKIYKGVDLINVSTDNLELPDLEQTPGTNDTKKNNKPDTDRLVELFKNQLGDRVTEVRTTNRLIESPARLVDKQGSTTIELQKVYKYLNREYKVPQKILEINPEHKILLSLSTRFEGDPLLADVIEQIYENALLIEGLHPNPASMINRIQTFMAKSLD